MLSDLLTQINPDTTSDSQIILQFLTRKKQDLIEQQKAKGIRASGASADSLEVVAVSESIGQLKGADYFEQQEYGRKPTGDPSKDYVLSAAILEWEKYKPSFSGLSAKRQLALSFIISKNINRKGTKTYQSGKTSELFQDAFPDSDFDIVAEIFATKYTGQVLSNIVEQFKVN